MAFTAVIDGLQSLHSTNFVTADLAAIMFTVHQIAKTPAALNRFIKDGSELIKFFKKFKKTE